MATHFRTNTAIETVADTVAAVEAALDSDPETAAFAETWQVVTTRADALAENHRKLARAARRTVSRLKVADSGWDRTTAGFGRGAVDASDGRRDIAPYTRFFAKTTPSKAQTFGFEREVSLSRGWIAELARNPDEPLAKTWIPKLTAATDTLENAVKERKEALLALSHLQTSVALFIDEVNCELDRLEGDLKKLFAGSPDRVAAYLAATRQDRPAALSDETDEDANPSQAPTV